MRCLFNNVTGSRIFTPVPSDVEVVKRDLQNLFHSGYRSVTIVFAHSYTFPDHERQIGVLARSVGFTHVSESAQLLPMIKLVPRGVSSTADAYLTPMGGW